MDHLLGLHTSVATPLTVPSHAAELPPSSASASAPRAPPAAAGALPPPPPPVSACCDASAGVGAGAPPLDVAATAEAPA
jgi:hypothetical protein